MIQSDKANAVEVLSNLLKSIDLASCNKAKIMELTDEAVEEFASVQFELTKLKTEFDQQYHMLESDYEKCSNELQLSLKRMEEMESTLSASRVTNEENIKNLEEMERRLCDLRSSEMALKSDLELARKEKVEMADIMESRNNEVQYLKTQCEYLEKKLKISIDEKIEMLCKNEELTGVEHRLKTKEIQWESEKAMFMSEIESLRKNLSAKTDSVVSLYVEQENKKKEYEAQLKTLNSDLNNEKEAVERYKQSMNLLEQKMNELSDEHAALKTLGIEQQRAYENEISNLQETLNLQETENKSLMMTFDEMNSKIESLQVEIQVAQQEKMDLSSKFEVTVNDLQNSVLKRDEELHELNKELKRANELINIAMKENRLIWDDDVAKLSPSAVMTAKLLKPNMSFTQIYSEYIEMREQLVATRAEKEKIQRDFQLFMEDVKSKTPLLKKQKVDYERTLEINKTLQSAIDSINGKMEEIRSESLIKTRRLNIALKENSILKQENKDLSSQIKVLLRQVSILRGEMLPISNRSFDVDDHQNNTEPMNSSDVIDHHLITFSNVEELQEKNQKLLTVVRELTTAKELDEQAAIESKTSELNNTIKTLSEKVNVMSEQLDTYKNSVASLMKQRDAYKALVESKAPVPICDDEKMLDGRYKSRISQLEETINAKEAEIERLNAQHECAVEKLKENIKSLTEDADKYRVEAFDAKSNTVILESKLQQCKDKISVLQFNIENLHAEINGWNKRYLNLMDSHNRIQSESLNLNQSLFSLNEKNKLLESQQRSVVCERDMLTAKVQSLEKEIEMLKTQNQSQKSLAAIASTLQESISQSEFNNKFMMERYVANLEKEVKLLKESLSREEQVKSLLISSHESEVKDLRRTIEKERNANDSSRSLLMEQKDKVLKLMQELSDAEAKLKTNEIVFKVSRNSSSSELLDRMSLLESENRELQCKLKLQNSQLSEQITFNKELQASITEYKELSQNLDSTLHRQIEQYNSKSSQYEENLKSLQNQIDEKNDEIQSWKKKYEDQNNEIAKINESLQNQIQEHMKAVEEFKTKILDSVKETNMWKAENERLTSLLAIEQNEKSELRTKLNTYSEKLMNAEAVTLEKEKELIEYRNQLTAVNDANQSLEISLFDAEENAKVAARASENLKKKFDDLLCENRERLQFQEAEIERLAAKLAVVKVPQHNVEAVSTEDEIDKRYLNLLEINRILRKEKAHAEEDIAQYKLEVMKLKSQCEELEQNLKQSAVKSITTSETEDEKSWKLTFNSLKDVKECNQQLMKENVQLVNDNQSLSQQLRASEQNIEDLQTQMNDLLNKLEMKTASKDDNKVDVRELQTTLASALSARTELELEVEALTKEVAALKSALQNCAASGDASLKSLEETRKSVLEPTAEGTSNLPAVDSEKFNPEKLLQNAMNAAKKRIHSDNELIKSLRDKLEALQTELISVKETQISDANPDLKEVLDGMKKSFDEEIQRYRSQIDSLWFDPFNQKDELIRLNQVNEQLQNKIREMSAASASQPKPLKPQASAAPLILDKTSSSSSSSSNTAVSKISQTAIINPIATTSGSPTHVATVNPFMSSMHEGSSEQGISLGGSTVLDDDSTTATQSVTTKRNYEDDARSRLVEVVNKKSRTSSETESRTVATVEPQRRAVVPTSSSETSSVIPESTPVISAPVMQPTESPQVQNTAVSESGFAGLTTLPTTESATSEQFLSPNETIVAVPDSAHNQTEPDTSSTGRSRIRPIVWDDCDNLSETDSSRSTSFIVSSSTSRFTRSSRRPFRTMNEGNRFQSDANYSTYSVFRSSHRGRSRFGSK